MKRKLLSILLALIMLFSTLSVLQMTVYAADELTPEGAFSISAPTKDITAHFWLDENGTPYYNVFLNGNVMVENSVLGISMSGIDSFVSGLSVKSKKDSSSNDEWYPISSDRSVVLDNYNMTEFVLENGAGNEIGLQFRVYDTGAAFRFVLPDGEYTISGETTQIKFPSGAVAYCHVGGNQTRPQKIAVENFSSATYRRPMTVEYPNGNALTVCEANIDDYCSFDLTKDTSTERAVNIKYCSSVSVKEGSPAATPWRVLVIGDTLAQLNENSDIVLNLNDEPNEAYNFSDWVKAGSVLRACTGMNNTAIKNVIDLASENGIQYVLLDTGWYGAEYDTSCDPRLDPDLLPEDSPLRKYILGDGIFVHKEGFDVYKDTETPGSMKVDVNIPELCSYGKEKGVGIMLYVNGVFFPDAKGRFTSEELFARFKEWGVAGVKPGFVKVRTQANENIMLDVIEAAAKYQLIMTIHDEYVPTGIERTFPNCLTTEGIAGDEEVRSANDVPADITTLFTRTVQGPTDHTFCYPGKATKAYALASPICFKSGLNLLYWYASPAGITDNIDIWKNLPGKYDEVKVLEGKAYGYATFARRSGTDWYIGSLSAEDRLLEIKLDFLEKDTKYVAQIWADEIGADAYASGGISDVTNTDKAKQVLEYSELIVDSDTVLTRPLGYGNGYAVKLHIASEEEMTSLDVYNSNVELLKSYIAKAALLSGDNYSSATWNELEKALEVANKIFEDIGSYTDEQVEEAARNIIAAIDGLRSVKDLTDALAKIKFLSQDMYTKSSWDNLQAAVDEAELILGGASVSQEDIDASTANINKAYGALVLRANLVESGSMYLSDISYDSSRSFAHANAIKKDTSYYGTDIRLMVNGTVTTFSKGLSAHAQSEVYYDVSGLDYDFFEAYVGVDYNKPTQGNVIFKVYADGILIYESNPSGTGSQNAQYFRVPVKGVNELLLVSDMNGTNDGDHASWANARFVNMEQSGYDIESASYLSDMTHESSTLYNLTRDVAQNNNPIALTSADGTSMISYEKGIGTHAKKDTTSAVVYNIEDMGFERFEAWTGISYMANDSRASIIFRVYLDTLDSEPVFDSGVMNYRTPAKHVSVDVKGAKKLILQADCNGDQSADHGVWADAKLEILKKQARDIVGITVNGNTLDGFKSSVYDYTYAVNEGDELPKVDVILPDEEEHGITYSIAQPEELDGSATINVTRNDGSEVTYTVDFRKIEFTGTYLTDLNPKEVTTHGSAAFRDVSYEGKKMAVTAADGESAMEFERGLGTHAATASGSYIVYDVSDMNFDVFQAWAGISYYKNDPRSSVKFSVFVDNESMPRYTTGEMNTRTPAEFISVDISGAKTVKLYFDACGNNSADHANLADAKFMRYSDNGDFSAKIDEKAYDDTLFNTLITVPGDVKTVTIRNEKGTKIGIKSLERIYDGEKTAFDVSMLLATPGYGRILSVYNGETLLGRYAVVINKTEQSILSVEAPETYEKGQHFEVGVVATDKLNDIKFYNEKGNMISAKLVSKAAGDDRTVSFKYSMAVGTSGERTITVKARREAEKDYNYTSSFDITITDPVIIPEIFSLDAPKAAVKNGKFVVTVVCSSVTTKVAFTNESGSNIGKKLISVTKNEDGTKTLVYEMSIASTGERTITAKAGTNGDVYGPDSELFDIVIV